VRCFDRRRHLDRETPKVPVFIGDERDQGSLVAIKILDPGPIPHAQIERFDDPDIETALKHEGCDPARATYRLVEMSLDELYDTRWFPGNRPWDTHVVDALTCGASLPPVIVIAGREGGYGLIDGLNRTYAHWVLRRPRIRAYELLNRERGAGKG
jgi:hypothetical protein